MPISRLGQWFVREPTHRRYKNSIQFAVPVVALETHGSNCFYNAISLNTQGFSSKVPSLPKRIPPEAPFTVRISEEHQVAIPHMHMLTSRAVSLGATWPAPGVVRMALNHAGGVTCVCIPDELAMFTARGFAGERSSWPI